MDLHRIQLSCDMNKMAFRNSVVSKNDKYMSFIFRTRNEGSFDKGSPSAFVNNNDIDISPARPQHAPLGSETMYRSRKDQAKLGRQPRESSIYQLPLPKPQDKKLQCFMLSLRKAKLLYQSLLRSSKYQRAFRCLGLSHNGRICAPRPWTNILENFSLEKLLNLHDNGYTRQTIVDNQEAELKDKYDGVMVGLDENLVVIDLRAKGGQKERVVALELKCNRLEKEKARLCELEVRLRKEIDYLKLQCIVLKQYREHCHRKSVVAKVVPYIAIELYHSHEVGQVVGNIVKAAIFHGRCSALEEMTATKKPLDLSKSECYRPIAEEEYNEAGNTYIMVEYPFLKEATKDPSATLEDLLSKKPQSLKPPSPTKKSSLMKPPPLVPATTV
ncbi:hypothetical protein Tco_0570478 [Tanacetum coccineum]